VFEGNGIGDAVVAVGWRDRGRGARIMLVLIIKRKLVPD